MTYTRARTPAQLEAELFKAELAAWNAANKRARWWYRTHPSLISHGGCSLCNAAAKGRYR